MKSINRWSRTLFFLATVWGGVGSAHSSIYDLEQDYTGENPTSVWSYGWKGTLGGAFGLLAHHGVRHDGLEYWMLSPSQVPVVYRNGSTNTIIDNAGQGVFLPGSVWTGPGHQGTAQNYCVIRFTAPVSGLYRLQTAAQSVLDGNLASDADFHVLHNGTELFGQNVPANQGTSYSNTVELAEGETIDLVTGRGDDNLFEGSGLKIKAYLDLVEEHETPPSIVQGPANAAVFVGGDVSFTVQAAGTAPLAYQWLYNGDALSDAHGITLTLSNVQPEQAGGYSVRVSNAVGAVTSRVATLTVLVTGTHDLERDYTGNNPGGVWSYGWKGTLGGAFGLLAHHGVRHDGLEYWMLSPSQVPVVYRNGSTNTIIDNAGQGVFLPGSVWTGPGHQGTAQNYCVIRFAAPVSGLYRLQTAVHSVLDGNLATDADFHVLHNDVELFGENVPPREGTVYTNTLEVAAGETIDLVTGRGDDNLFEGSGLKIRAYLTLLEEHESGPRILHGPANAAAYVGGDASFAVQAAGTAPLAYQWLYNGDELSDEQGSTLTLNNVQPEQAGGYAVRVSNAVGVVTSTVATLTVQVANTHDLERDYTGTNPAGVWSYGWKGTLGGDFGLMPFHGSRHDGLEFWMLSPTRVPVVYHNSASNTIIDNAGQGVFLPGSVWTGPGHEGTAENYSVIRFTAPVSGLYRLETAAQSVLNGDLASDAGFYVLHNDLEIFEQNVPPREGTAHTSSLELAVGDTIDLVTGRGADNRFQGSGLKIKAYLTLTEEIDSPPRILQQPANALVFAGGDASFAVQAMGTAPLTYQWLYNGDELSDEHGSTLTLNNVQPEQAGGYAVRVSNAVGAVTSIVATLTVQVANTHDLERDYTGTNPAGVWSYGWKGTLSGAFGLLVHHGVRHDGLEYWMLSPSQVPVVYRNGATNTIIDNAGQGVFLPGSVWTGPGHEGTAENFSVIRFTAPASGLYHLQAAAQSVLDGDLATDADFHVLHNNTELFGENVPPREGTVYTNMLELAVGDTIDLVTGRGGDDRFEGSGLKIKAFLDLVDVSHAPTAHIALVPTVQFGENETIPCVVSGNRSNAPIILDARGSTDPNGDPLTFAWFIPGFSGPFATTDLAVPSADVGSHRITLVVSDGRASATRTIAFEVITAEQALIEIGRVVEQSSLTRSAKRSLEAALETALGLVQRGRDNRAVIQLQAIEWKVRSQVRSSHPALAERLIHATDKVIYALALARMQPDWEEEDSSDLDQED